MFFVKVVPCVYIRLTTGMTSLVYTYTFLLCGCLLNHTIVYTYISTLWLFVKSYNGLYIHFYFVVVC